MQEPIPTPMLTRAGEPWVRLLELLAPIHERARVSARRLARSNSDGDDLFHDAVLRAFEKLPTLRDPERFGGWFYAVLLSVHRNRSRRSFWRRFVQLDEGGERGGALPEVATADLESERQQAARLSGALATLPAVQREAVVLHELEGYSLQEVAAMQGVTVAAVKTRAARGRARLRRHYERLGFRAPTVRTRGAPESEAARLDHSMGMQAHERAV